MNEAIINYIIRSSLSLSFFYLFYIAVLGREKMHKFNRFYLLASLIFSFVTPLMSLPVTIAYSPVNYLYDVSGYKESNDQLQILASRKESLFNFEMTIRYF